MFSKLGLFSVILSITTVALASPIDRKLRGVQCRCVSLSIQASPSTCATIGFQSFGWSTAESVAYQRNFKLEFASQTTIDRILALGHPLPASVFQAISHGEANLIPADGKETEDKMICGYGDEVRKLSGRRKSEPVSHQVGQVIGIFMLLVIAYVVGEYIWTNYQEGNIRLVGEEQDLTWTTDRETQPDHEDVDQRNLVAPSNIS